METTFLSENSVTVTNTRFIASGQTYAMAGVTSVYIQTNPPSVAGPLIVVIGTLLMLYGALSMKSWEVGCTGGGLAVLGYFLTKGARITYTLVLRTSAGEARAVFSQDKQFIQRVHDATSSAIVARG